MFWLRRTIAVPLALIFIILGILLMVGFRINATLANADFYHDQLEQADIYNFVYEKALPEALEEAEIGGDVAGSDLEPHIIALIEQTLPREWLETQVEQAIDQMVPYLWGASDGFLISVPLQDRVEAGAEALEGILHNDEVFLSLYDWAIDRALDEMESQVPAFFAQGREEMAQVVRIVLPPEWVRRQLEDAIDEVIPYLTGDAEKFQIQVAVSERLDALESALVDILRSPEVYHFLLDEAVLPVIRQNLEGMAQLPFGVSLTDDEILAVVKEALPLEWYQAQEADMVGQIFAYLEGTQETLEVVIALADRKPAIASALGDLADQKLEVLVDSLPVCTEGQLLDLLLDPPLDRLPECRPLDMTYQELKDVLGVDIGVITAPLVDLWIPDQWVLTDSELSQAFGGEEDWLRQARPLLQEGLTYTEADLRDQLGADYAMVAEVRGWITTGLVFSEQDLRRQMDAEGIQTLDSVRSTLRTARSLRLVAWLVPLLLLVAIGALSARRWSSKLLWAAVVLALMAIVAWVVFGPVFSAVAQPQIDEALDAAGQGQGFQALVATKVADLAQNAISSFVGGLKAQALGLFIASLVIIGGGVFWYLRESREED